MARAITIHPRARRTGIMAMIFWFIFASHLVASDMENHKYKIHFEDVSPGTANVLVQQEKEDAGWSESLRIDIGVFGDFERAIALPSGQTIILGFPTTFGQIAAVVLDRNGILISVLKLSEMKIDIFDEDFLASRSVSGLFWAKRVVCIPAEDAVTLVFGTGEVVNCVLSATKVSISSGKILRPDQRDEFRECINEMMKSENYSQKHAAVHIVAQLKSTLDQDVLDFARKLTVDDPGQLIGVVGADGEIRQVRAFEIRKLAGKF
jgi:hypothetical protein